MTRIYTLGDSLSDIFWQPCALSSFLLLNKYLVTEYLGVSHSPRLVVSINTTDFLVLTNRLFRCLLGSLSFISSYQMQSSLEIAFLVHLFSLILQDHKDLGFKSGLIYFTYPSISSVQSLSRVRLFVTPWNTAPQASLSITNSTSIESVMPSNRLILCHPPLLLPPIHPSIRVFSSDSTLHMRWPKYWSFSFSICPSNGHPELISFRMDWLDLLTVQGTLKSLFQHLSSKASIVRHSSFFTIQLSHPYMTTEKTIDGLD